MKSFKEIIREDAEYDRIHELGKSLDEHYHPTNKDHWSAIKNYTYNSHYLNNHLWMEHRKDPNHDLSDSKGCFKESDISSLDKATDAKTPHDLTVYSKSKHDPRKMIKEGVMHHPAFMSTSLSEKVAKHLAWNHEVKDGIEHHHIYKIHVPKGAPGAYIAAYSHLPTQKEFILKRGSNLKYNGTDTKEVGKIHYHTHNMDLMP